jgi:rubrerythrin
MSINIFEYAMQMEKDGETYYRELAAGCTMEGLKKILTLLAEDEVSHYETFRKLKETLDVDFPGTGILGNAKNIFIEMREKEKNFNTGTTGIELYEKAVEIEKKSEAFYKEKSETIEDSNTKCILLKIAEDEKKHRFLLENMIKFLSRPQTWVENAEFNHLEEY